MNIFAKYQHHTTNLKFWHLEVARPYHHDEAAMLVQATEMCNHYIPTRKLIITRVTLELL